MNTNPTVASALRSIGRAATCIAALALAGCGQTWQDKPGYVSVGGDVAGLTGTVVLQNNGQDDLTLASNAPFTFALQIANGASFAVTVKHQPTGQTCTITGATGVAIANVHGVHVACVSYARIGGTLSGLTGPIILQNNGGDALATTANGSFTFATAIAPGATYAVSVQSAPTGENCTVTNGTGTVAATGGDITNIGIACAPFTLRMLPAVYTTGKAINFSPYRAGGPGNEVPTDAQVSEDLALVHAAGYRLLRLFGSDSVSEQTLRLAAANFPDIQFQLGVYIFGIDTTNHAACDSNSLNTGQIATGIRLANQYPNVATVSIGNETSFFRSYMPVHCLVGYIQSVRTQVAQPVTADDDYTYYVNASTDPDVSPDAVLATIDFVSIHSYPMSNPTRWNWQQPAVAAGPLRAKAMMETALNGTPAAGDDGSLKSTYAQVARHLYRSAAGTTASIGASLPIVVGETGWKARQTNASSAIEGFAALPMNAKWYVDLMYGSPVGAGTNYPAWQGSAGGPVAIFYFEAFDETWKGADDGWGLWTTDRRAAPRYALCGTYASFTFAGVTYPAAPACNSPETYPGAGYSP